MFRSYLFLVQRKFELIILREYALIVAGRSKRNLLVRATFATLIKKVLTFDQIRVVHEFIKTGK